MVGKRDQTGQALVEMALVLPVLLLLLMGIIEFGRIFNASLVVTQAAREGARTGAVGGSDEEILAAVRSAASGLDQKRLQVVIEPQESGDGTRNRGDQLTVRVDYTVPLVTPLLSEFIPDPYPLSALTVMRVE